MQVMPSDDNRLQKGSECNEPMQFHHPQLQGSTTMAAMADQCNASRVNAIKNPKQDEQETEPKSPETNSWWKKYRKHVLVGFSSLIILGFVAAIVILAILFVNAKNNGSDESESATTTTTTTTSCPWSYSLPYFADRANKRCDTPEKPRSTYLRQRLYSTVRKCCETEFLNLQGDECMMNSVQWGQRGQTIVGEMPHDLSGKSVSLSGDGKTLAIGAPMNNGNGLASGHVRVYHLDDICFTWNQLGQDLDGEGAQDLSGYSVSLSSDGNTPGNHTAAPGHVKVYHKVYHVGRKGTTPSWEQLGETITGDAKGDQSGVVLFLSANGRTVAIAAGGKDYPGRVRVYNINDIGMKWEKVGQDIKGESTGDLSGYSVALSFDGKIVAIGAPRHHGKNGDDMGHVRVYQLDGSESSWNQLGQDIDGEAAGDWSGVAVALSDDGKTVAIGASFNDGELNNSEGGDVGHVRVYELNEVDSDSSWEQLGQDIDGEAMLDFSGDDLSISADGKTIAIGAPRNDGQWTDPFIETGHVRVYHLKEIESDPIWKQLGQDIDGEAAHDHSGSAVALSADGKFLAIASRYNTNYSGHVRVFDMEYW